MRGRSSWMDDKNEAWWRRDWRVEVLWSSKWEKHIGTFLARSMRSECKIVLTLRSGT